MGNKNHDHVGWDEKVNKKKKEKQKNKILEILAIIYKATFRYLIRQTGIVISYYLTKLIWCLSIQKIFKIIKNLKRYIDIIILNDIIFADILKNCMFVLIETIKDKILNI